MLVRCNTIQYLDERQNPVNGCFASTAPRKVWFEDISYIGIKEGNGKPYDNAMMESFYWTPKGKLVSERKFESGKEAGKEELNFIYLHCNRIRTHSAPGYASPREFRERHAQINLT